jgi:hypothetical protein
VPPQVDEFCMVTDNTYSREEILATERHVLDALEWELTTPTPLSFLRRFVKAAQVDTAKDKRCVLVLAPPKLLAVFSRAGHVGQTSKAGAKSRECVCVCVIP